MEEVKGKQFQNIQSTNRLLRLCALLPLLVAGPRSTNIAYNLLKDLTQMAATQQDADILL